MENNNSEKKRRITKSLAVIGVVAIILLLAWVSIQLVSVAPRALSSLASLAESVYQVSPTEEDVFKVTSNETVLQSGENVTLSWEEANRNGSYIFNYNCTDGVAVDIVSTDEELRGTSCDTNYNVGDINELELKIDSEKNRFIDVPYTIAFLATNDTSPRAEAKGMIAVTNPQLVTTSAEQESGEESIQNTDNEDVVPTEQPAELVTNVENTEETAPSSPTPNQPPAPVFEQEFVYEIPVSNPNGRSDLSIRLIGVGELFNDTSLRETGSLDEGENGAIQFEVKNLGTKTSNEWEYAVTVDGETIYRADEQEALKPNERSVITLSFPVPEDESSVTVAVSIDSTGDRNSINDSFQELVVVN